ncbi:helix-turn-helix domain-containing protein [Flavobacterium sp. RS13.1]|uniref:helix-turn-helix domain-containing protein n=1 Tax=Flavobacterium sp. RS13.1 TaxID=3400345 RepID=UPI003AAF34B1
MGFTRKYVEKKKAGLLLKQGFTKKRIATLLKVTEKTVRKWELDFNIKSEAKKREQKLKAEVRKLKKENAQLRAIIADKAQY